MKVIVCDNYEKMSLEAARIFATQIIIKPNCILGLATGSTPVGMYNYLSKKNKKGELDFSDVTTFNLDEYCDLPVEDKNSYFTFMHENLFNHIDVNEDNVNFLNGNAVDAEAECNRYDNLILEKKIDIQLLGVGRNGHIGFNEP